MIFSNKHKKNLRLVCALRAYSNTTKIFIFCRSNARTNCVRLEHGFHNVSRWMTWLPISLKNAAKCDKWYQLQNHSITESLNANGAREKPSTGLTRACRNLSVEQKPKNTEESWLVEKKIPYFFFRRSGGYPESPRQTVDSWVIDYFFIWTVCVFCVCVCLSEKCNTHTYTLSHQDKKKVLQLTQKKNLFCYRPECGRVTRRT